MLTATEKEVEEEIVTVVIVVVAVVVVVMLKSAWFCLITYMLDLPPLSYL